MHSPFRNNMTPWLLLSSSCGALFGQVSWVKGVILWYQSSLGCSPVLPSCWTFQPLNVKVEPRSWPATPKHCKATSSSCSWTRRTSWIIFPPIVKTYIYQVCRTQVGLFAPRSSINSQLVNSRGTKVVRQQLQAADQKANNSLGVEPFVMSWQQASSGLTWGQGGVPLLGNLHILSPLFLFHTLLLGNTLLYWTGRHRYFCSSYP